MFKLTLIICLISLGIGRTAAAYYVLPYDMNLGKKGAIEIREGKRRILTEDEDYTVVVLLADYYRNFYGVQDELQELMLRNHHANPERVLSDFVQIPYEWYQELLRAHGRIYGKEEIEQIIRMLQHHKLVLDGKTSLVIIFEKDNLNKPVALLRTVVSPPGGLLPSDRQHYGKGLSRHFPAARTRFGNQFLPQFQSDPFLQHHYSLELNEPTLWTPDWLQGESIELKNFGMKQRKFFPYLYLIARHHKLFSFGSHAFPDGITHWPNGRRITDDERENYGIHISKLWLLCYTDALKDYYVGHTGFSEWDMINNDETFGLNAHFMNTTPKRLEDAIKASVQWEPGSSTKSKRWLVFNETLAQKFKSADCASSVTGKQTIVTPQQTIWTPP